MIFMLFERSLPLVLLLLLGACTGAGKNVAAMKPPAGPASTMKPVALTCNYGANPLGTDDPTPHLSWMLEAPGRGRLQSAYQVLVAGTRDDLEAGNGDLWNSGKVFSDQSLHVAYDGKPLASRQRCFWKVRVWDELGRPGPFSETAHWEMGLLAPADWRAQWISAPGPARKDGQSKNNDPSDEAVKEAPPEPSPHFRRAFSVDRAKTISRARAYVCGLGYYELYLNGRKVGDHVLDPAFTRYDRRRLYVTYDVTDQVKAGDNAMGVILGNGWYNMHTRAVWNFDQAPWRARPVMICQLMLTFSDGSTQCIGSDETWRVGTGPILFESIRNGETYDARLEIPGWSAAGFDDGAWPRAVAVADDRQLLSAQMQPPMKVMKTISPVAVTEPVPGTFVFDMGQNMAGWARLRVSGPAGTKVQLKYGERLAADGLVDQKMIALHVKEYPFQTDTYILKGGGEEVWEPRFSYHGFQYVAVTGFPGKPTLNALRGRVVHTAFEKAGMFRCSSALFNKIQAATEWAFVGNFHGYPTDCPHREKNGWTGDAHLAAEQGLLNYHSAGAYAKWLNDLRDEQRESGELPGIVPTSGWGYHWGNGPAWDSAYPLITWYLYRYCGDRRILRVHYDRLKRYVDYLTGKAKDHIVSIGLNDWAPARTKTPADITSTGYYYCDTVIVARIARLMDWKEEAGRYEDLARKIRDAFNRHFYDAEKGTVKYGTQTALSCALYHDLIWPQHQDRVMARLVEAIKARDGHLDAGILGTKYLLNVLADRGRPDLAHAMAAKTDFPSWGHWIAQGATTLWEQWNGTESRNHVMFGDVSAFFYESLAGIRQAPDGAGYKKIIIAPKLLGDLKWVKAWHRCMYGLIESAWRLEDGMFTLDVTIPVNTTAEIHLPGDEGVTVRSVGSGTHQFKAKL